MRKLALFAARTAVVIINHRRRTVPHVSVYQLIGSEQARLMYVLTQRTPEPKGMAVLRRCLTVVDMMFLAGNKPSIKA